MCELYIELPARRCHPEAFFGQAVNELTKTEVTAPYSKGNGRFIVRTAKFGPYLAGSEFSRSTADIMFFLAVLIWHQWWHIKMFWTWIISHGSWVLKNLLAVIGWKTTHVQKKLRRIAKAGTLPLKQYIASLELVIWGN